MIVVPVAQSHDVPVAPPPRPGAGVWLTRNAVGDSYSAPRQGAVFNHAWRPFLRAGAVTLNLGLVQSMAGDGPLEPKIKVNGQLIPMSGNDGKSKSPLKLDPDVADDNGRSWAVLEVYPDDDGELTKDSKIEIVHSAVTVSRTEDVGRKAIALILWRGRSPVRVRPIVQFDLVYERVIPSAGGGLPRHYFL